MSTIILSILSTIILLSHHEPFHVPLRTRGVTIGTVVHGELSRLFILKKIYIEKIKHKYMLTLVLKGTFLV